MQSGKQVIIILNDTSYNRAKYVVLKEYKERAGLVFRDERKGVPDTFKDALKLDKERLVGDLKISPNPCK